MASRVDLEAELATLASMPPAQLREKWAAVTGRPLPRVSPQLLRLALAWELQASFHGGLPRRTSQKLAQLAAGRSVTREARGGMRLVREWGGKVHVVTIGEDKVIRWNEREWRSLSEVARAITGTRWSGPAFFGLRTRKAAAA
jgi:hypothetical protein